MENREQIASDIAELCLLDFNNLSQKPLFYHFNHMESGSATIETKITESGEGLKKRLFNTILIYLQENGW